MGMAALILGMVGLLAGIFPVFFWVAGILGIIGLIIGIIGRGRVKRGEATNGTIALWGIITSGVAVVVSIIGAVTLVGLFADLDEERSAGTETTVSPSAENEVSPSAENTVSPSVETSTPVLVEETAPTVPEEVDVYKLEVGDCYGEVPEGDVVTVPVVPCSEPHSEEVFAAVSLPNRDFPGEDAILAQADELCFAEFESFVGLSYEESVLDFAYVYPSEESWLEGDRLVTCTIFDPGEKVTGSLRGVQR
jgi:Septum formation